MVLNGVRLLMKAGEVVSPDLTAKLAIEMLFRTRLKKTNIKHKAFWETGKALVMPSGCEAKIFGHGDKVIWVVHGWQSHSSRFRNIIQLGVEQGYSVVAWNGPGHGRSQGNRTNLAHFSRKLHLDLASFNKRISFLIGHSFGAAASAYVSSMGAQVENLILIASPSNAERVFERFWDFIGLQTKARIIFKEKTQLEMQASLKEMSLELFASQLSQHILLLHDKEDRMIPYSDATRVASLNPKVKLHTTDGLGHYKLVGSSETLDQIRAFMREREMGS